VLTPADLPDMSTVSHARQLPKRVSAALEKASLKASEPPRSLSMRLATSPTGLPPPLGDITVQNSEWLAWPPALLRSGPRLSSGSASRLEMISSALLPSHCVPSSAALALLM